MISKKALEKDFQKHSERANSIKRYHQLKPKQENEWNGGRRHGSIMNPDEEEKGIDFGDLTKEEIEILYKTQIYLYMELNSLVFTQKGHEPDPNYTNEKYFLEVKACYKAMRRTMPEDYKDFAKSVINEFFNMAELVIENFNLEKYFFLK